MLFIHLLTIEFELFTMLIVVVVNIYLSGKFG